MPEDVLQVEQVLRRLQSQKKIYRGTLGRPGSSVVKSANRPGYHWVTLLGNDAKAVQAYNPATPPTYDLSVLVEEEVHPRTGTATFTVLGMTPGMFYTFGAEDLYPVSGDASWVTYNDGIHGCGAWSLPDGSSTSVGTAFEYEGSQEGSDIYVDIWYASTATSGAVVLQAGVACIANGQAVNMACQTNNVVSSVPGSAGNMQKATCHVNVSYQIGNLIRVSVARLGADGSDNASGSCRIIAITVRFG